MLPHISLLIPPTSTPPHPGNLVEHRNIHVHQLQDMFVTNAKNINSPSIMNKLVKLLCKILKVIIQWYYHSLLQSVLFYNLGYYILQCLCGLSISKISICKHLNCMMLDYRVIAFRNVGSFFPRFCNLRKKIF